MQIARRPLVLTLLFALCFALAGMAGAQDATPPPETTPEIAEATEETAPTITLTPTIDFTATQAAINGTSTQEIVVSTATQAAVFRQQTHVAATQTQVANATASATALTPMPTQRYPNFSSNLTVDPPSADGTYNSGSEITFNVLVENQGGATTLDQRNIVVVLPLNTELFIEPTPGTISGDGQFSTGTVRWTLNLVEGTSENLTITTRIRDNLGEDTELSLRAVVRTSDERVVLNQSDPLTFTLLAPDAETITSTTTTTSKEPQGSGLFQNEGSFALLIGGFFGSGVLLIFGLGLFSIYKSDDDENRETMFRSTTEILLLLIVLFSVIVMGVQNAIDRESINAIIGGIVGYVAGRVTTKGPKLEDVVKALRPDTSSPAPTDTSQPSETTSTDNQPPPKGTTSTS